MSIDNHRDQFPVFSNITYINSCSYGALANSVKQAFEQYLDDRIQYGERWQHWVEMLESLRANTAQLFGASSNEIALTSSLSAGLNSLVSGLSFADKTNVVCTEYDFPTTAHIWHAQKQRGANIISVAIDHSDSPEQAICDQIDDNTAVVSIPYICYRHGRKLDVKKIIHTARQHNALIILDAYQGAGTFDIDVRELDVDVLLGGYLKYLLGTSGLAYMYVRDDIRKKISPKTSGWFAQENIEAMDISDNCPSQSARKFEGGTPDISAIYACLAGLKIISDIGPAVIEKKIQQLTSRIKQAANANNWTLATGDGAHGPLITIKSTDMYQLVEKLREDGIVISCRDNNIRISPHFYNTAEDIDKLIGALKKYAFLLA